MPSRGVIEFATPLERSSWEEALQRPICGAIHPRESAGPLRIVCTYPPDHPGPYHHEEGKMSCYAWMGCGPAFQPPPVNNWYPGHEIKHCRFCNRCKECGGRLKRWRTFGRWRGHRGDCSLADVATEVVE